jgi:hypothetical protein
MKAVSQYISPIEQLATSILSLSMNSSFEDPKDLGGDVVDLLAEADPPPEKEIMGLLFRPLPDNLLSFCCGME